MRRRQFSVAAGTTLAARHVSQSVMYFLDAGKQDWIELDWSAYLRRKEGPLQCCRWYWQGLGENLRRNGRNAVFHTFETLFFLSFFPFTALSSTVQMFASHAPNVSVTRCKDYWCRLHCTPCCSAIAPSFFHFILSISLPAFIHLYQTPFVVD